MRRPSQIASNSARDIIGLVAVTRDLELELGLRSPCQGKAVAITRTAIPGSGVLISRCQFDRYVRALTPKPWRRAFRARRAVAERVAICSGSSPMP